MDENIYSIYVMIYHIIRRNISYWSIENDANDDIADRIDIR